MDIEQSQGRLERLRAAAAAADAIPDRALQ